MVATVVVGMISNGTWIIWQLINRRPYGWKGVFAIVFIMVFMGLELGDFSPLWHIFDAHSLWHAVTIPWAFMWNSFVIEDSNYEAKRGKKTL